MFIAFDDTIAHMRKNKKVEQVATELLIRCKKLNVSLVLVTQFYFAVTKNARLNSAHYFIMKYSIKRGLQHIAFNHSSDIDLKYFMNPYKN